jgi:hypothetical protein
MSLGLWLQPCALVAPEKLPDRLLCSGVLSTSAVPNTADECTLLYLFEVSRPWLPSSQLFPNLVEVLVEQAALLVPTEALDVQFERLLRALNHRLNAVSEAGETDWIGNLSGTVVLIGNQELHFTQTGSVPGYLLQRNRIRQITDDPDEGHDAHPLKTFTQISSGPLAAGDQLLFANRELYSEISLDALRRIMNSATPFQSNMAIAKELRTEKNPKVVALIIKATDLETAQPTEEPSVVSLSEQLEGRAQRAKRALTPVVRGISSGLAKLADKTGDLAGNLGKASLDAATQARSIAREQVLRQRAKQQIAKQLTLENQSAGTEKTIRPVSELIPPKSRRVTQTQEANQPESQEPETTADFIQEFEPELLAEAEIGSVVNLQKPTPAPSTTAKPSGKRLVFFVTKRLPFYIVSSFHKFVLWLQVPGNKRKAAIGLAGFLILITVWGAVAQRNRPSSESGTAVSEVRTKLDEVRDIDKKTAAAIQLDQKVEASRLLESGFTTLRKLSGLSQSDQEEYDALWEQLSNKADSLTTTTRLTQANASYTFASSVVGFIPGLPYFYGIEDRKGVMQRTGRGETQQVRDTITLPGGGQDTIVAITVGTDPEIKGYVLTSQNKVYRIVQFGSTTQLLPVSPEEGSFAIGSGIATFGQNLYILNGKDGLVWRYSGTGTRFAKGTSLFDDSSAALDTISIAIDGAIYLLKTDGNLVKFSGGREQPFAYKDLPILSSRLVRPVQVVTNSDMDYLYVLDGGTVSSGQSTAKVLQFKKDGTFVRQYAFPKDFSNVRSIAIDEQARQMWVVNGATIAEFSLNQ